MIKLTKMNGDTFYLNSDLIETMEQMPDHAVIFLTNGKTLVVSEPAVQIKRKCIEYEQSVLRGPMLARKMGETGVNGNR